MNHELDFDDEDAPTPRRRGSGRSSPLRFITPGTFGLAIVLFFLPWTDLSCNGPTGKMQLATQSGLQSATGGASEGEGFAKLRETEEKQTGKKSEVKFDLNELQNEGAAGKGPKKEPEKALLLWVYLALVIGGAVVPMLLSANQVRGGVVLAFAGLAIALLGLQLAIGFPFANAAAEFNDEMKKAGDIGKNAGGADAQFEKQLGGMMAMKCSYLPSFWISIALLAASGVLGLVQVLAGPSAAKAKPRRQPRDDPDDQADD